jgi:hypothetical protein
MPLIFRKYNNRMYFNIYSFTEAGNFYVKFAVNTFNLYVFISSQHILKQNAGLSWTHLEA